MSNMNFHIVSFVLLIVFVSSYNIPLTTNHCLLWNTSCNQTVEESCKNKSWTASWVICSSSFHCPLQQDLLVMNSIMWVLNFENSPHQGRRSWYVGEKIHLGNELRCLGRVQHIQNMAYHNLVWTRFTFIEILTLQSFQNIVRKKSFWINFSRKQTLLTASLSLYLKREQLPYSFQLLQEVQNSPYSSTSGTFVRVWKAGIGRQ